MRPCVETVAGALSCGSEIDIQIPLTADGGPGLDTIGGGRLDDTLRGGADSDSLFGGTQLQGFPSEPSSNDILRGDGGVDGLFGLDGRDTFRAVRTGTSSTAGTASPTRRCTRRRPARSR